MLNTLRLTLQLFKCLHLNKQQQVHAKKRRSNKAKRSNESAFYSFRKYQKSIANVILISYISMPGALLADGLSAAAGSSNAPTFDTSASGVPIVNINAPSRQGVSRNEYENLNVDSIGLIFNNSTAIVNTDLAGYIDGNARLNGKNASIILNEVTGNSHSALNGYMEIAGQEAELVIANRHGITCNGCGFINTTRGVLTTGEAIINNGALEGYNVAQGQVTIEELGLNSPETEQIDILARSIAVNGELWANQTTLISGQNNIKHLRDNEGDLTVHTLTKDEVDATTINSTKSQGTPTFALDVAAIGGMYANRITLIGTETGLGVNNNGSLVATEKMVLQADGTITNSGALTADSISITHYNEPSAIALNNQGDIATQNSLSIDANKINNNGNIIAQGDNTVTAKEIENQGNITSGANLLITTTALTNGTDTQGNKATLKGQQVDLQTASLTNGTQGQIVSNERLLINDAGQAADINNAGILLAQDIDLTASTLDNSGTIISQTALDIDANIVTNSGNLVATNNNTITANTVENQGNITSGANLLIITDALTNSDTAQLIATDDLTVSNAEQAVLINNAGILSAQNSILQATELTNSGDIVASNTSTINANSLSNSGNIVATNDNAITANSVDNQGSITSNEALLITTNSLTNGTNTQGNKATLRGGSVNLQTPLLVNGEQGQIISADALNANNAGQATTITNEGIFSALNTDLIASLLTNTGTIVSQAALNIDADTVTNKSTGKLQSGENLLIAANDVIENDGAISSIGNITLNAENIDNNQTATVQALGDTNINVNDLVNNNGNIVGSDVSINAAKLNNNANAKIQSVKNLEITVDNAINNDGELTANENITTNSIALNNNASGIVQAGEASTINATNLVNNKGSIIGKDNVTNTTQFQNKGSVKLNGTLVINSSAINNQAVLNGYNIALVASGTLTNAEQGEIQATNELTVNQPNEVKNQGDIVNQGAITANNTRISSNTLNNEGHNALFVQDSLSIKTANNIINQGGALIYSFIEATFETAADFINSSSSIESDSTISITANNIINKKEAFEVETNAVTTNHTESLGASGKYHTRTRNYVRTTTTTSITKDSEQATILGSDLVTLTAKNKIDNEYSIISSINNMVINAPLLNNKGYSAKDTIVETGIDSLTYKKKVCKSHAKIGGKCLSSKKENRTDKVDYNNTTKTTVNHATATLTANGIAITGDNVNNIGATSTQGKEIQNKEKTSNEEVELDPVSSADIDVDIASKEIDEVNESTSSIDTDIINPVTPINSEDLSTPEEIDNKIIDKLLASPLSQFPDNPKSNKVFETRDVFTQYKNFISSDYFFEKLAITEQSGSTNSTKVLGDGFLEQKIIRDQILDLTGKQTLPIYSDIEEMYQDLMNNAVDQYDELQLSVGVTLSPEQINQLDEPIVWMVEQTVETPNGPVVALAPKVYLPSNMDMVLRDDGALISANTINIDIDGGFNNAGSMVAAQNITIEALQIENSGNLASAGDLTLDAAADIVNLSGTISANDALNIDAGGDFISKTETEVITNDSALGTTVQTLVGDTAQLLGGSINISAGNDLLLSGSDLTAIGDISLDAVNDLTFTALEIENSRTAGNYLSESDITHQVANINGDNINLNAGGTVTSEGAQVNAKNNLTVDANNIDLLAVVDTHTNENFIGSGSNYTKTSSYVENVISSTLSSGAKLALNAVNDIYSQATAFFAEESIAFAAGNDVILATQSQTQSNSSETKSKKSGFTGSKTSKTTTSSESVEQIGTSLVSNGGIQITTGNDLTLYGSTAEAEGSIDVDTGGDIQLLAAVNQESESYQSEKKGTFKVKTKSSGSVEQTAVVSGFTANNGDLSIEADGNISTEGATLASTNGTLSLGAGGAGAETATLDENGNYVNENGEAIGNITLGTKELHNSSWNESSSSLRGGLDKMMTGITALAAYATGGMSLFIPYEIEVGKSDSTRTDSTIHAVTTVNTTNLDIDAVNDVAFIGTDVTATDTANIDAKNVTIDAALNTTTHTESHSTQSMSSDGPSLSKETGEATLVSLSEIEQTDTTTTTSNEWQGANFTVGNLNINAEEDVAIIASDIDVTNDANIEGQNVLVGGREDTVETTTESVTKTKTLTIGVKNAYSDIYLAGRSVDKANEGIKDAEEAYDDAKAQVKAGTLSSNDLEFYEYQVDAAKDNLKYALLGLTNAAIAAATSNATLGFTATASASTTSSTNTQTVTQGTFNGSTINVGGNASVNSEKDLTLQGSSINATGILAANAENIEILAGTNTYTHTSNSESQGATASASYSGGPAISGSVGINASSSESHSESTSYTNSSLNGGVIVSNSDSLTLEGGNIYGGSVIINTDELNIISLQDTAKSKSKSESGGIGINGSYDIGSEKYSIDGGSLNYNQSSTESDYASVNQQSSITTGDGGYQINVTGNTNLVAGLITSNSNAETAGNNSFSTGTITQSNLENNADFSGESFGGDASVSKNESGKYGLTRSAGYGATEFSQSSTTNSGINTANIEITDSETQQALTGENTTQAIANIATTTTTETAIIDSGALNNNFDQAEVEEFVNNQQAITQAFDKNVTALKGLVNSQLTELKEQLESGEINQAQFNDKTETLQNYNLLLGTIGAVVGTPTNSLLGQAAAAASPTVSYAIGQYFKDIAANNHNGQLTGGEEAAHVLAHGVLAAAVAASGGNDGLTAGVTAATSEAAAPLLASWLYGSEDGSDLTSDQKETIAAILGLASTAVGASTGDLNNAVAAGQASDTAIDNNYLTENSMDTVRDCLAGSTCSNDKERAQVIANAEALSEILDDELSQLCKIDATSDACRTAINSATQYIGMTDAWNIITDDVSRSSINTFDYIFNSEGAEDRFALYYNTIDNRADFFGAANEYEQNLGLGAKWYGGAEFVSRAFLTGLGADDNGSWLTFAGGKVIAPFTDLYEWRDVAGDTLMNAGFENFSDLYNQRISDPIAWDINQLTSEQQALQEIHEEYIGDTWIFRYVGEVFTGVDITDYDSRINYGCSLLGLSKEQGCK